MATILVVDDSTISQRLLGYTLKKSSHTVITAFDGLEALEKLAATPCDLIIADLNMPEMDGLTMLRHIRANERYQHLPVIMLTASGQDEDRAAARAEGASDFLTKPSSSRELLETVQRLLG